MILAQQLNRAFEWTSQDHRIEHVRQLGTILAFDVKKDFIDQLFSQMFFSIGLDKGLLIRPIGNTVYVMPPYILNEEQAQFIGATVQSTLEATLAS